MGKNRVNYTIKQFIAEYPDDDACLDKIFQLRYGQIKCCPKCGSERPYVRVKNRRCYQCRDCYNQLYPTANTVFEKTRTPLTYWFFAMFLFCSSKNGLSACELQRQIGVTYKTAFRMLKQIRLLIKNDESPFSIGAEIELDETYVGGKNKNRHFDKKVKNSQGRAYKDKTPVFGMIERGGKVVTYQVSDTQSRTIKPLIYKTVRSSSTLYTDEYQIYNGLNKYYNHEICFHAKGQYVNGNSSTNRMENYWSVLKRTINGSYIHISKKYLQLYVNECTFRFNNRYSSNIFNELITFLAS